MERIEISAPIPEIIPNIIFLFRFTSSKNIEIGTHAGHIATAMVIKIVIGICCNCKLFECKSDNQTKPSENYCAANMNGIEANNKWDRSLVFLIVAMPITVSTVPETKLAVVEKHISSF